MFIFCNPNPVNNRVDDCVIRALSILLDEDWDYIFDDLCSFAHSMYDMPSSNAVWSEYLHEHGYKRGVIPDTCPMCYSIREFSNDHKIGRYLLATGTHVVTVINGDYYDTWDSGNEVPIYYFSRRKL